jgi:hypothetical protein
VATKNHEVEAYPENFGGRILFEIVDWDCTFHLALSSALVPRKYRFQGGLSFSHGFELRTRVVAPKSFPAKEFRIWLSSIGPEVRFGPKQLESVGQLVLHDPTGTNADRIGTLFIPEATRSTVATCLGSRWRYLHVWTFDEDVEGANVSGFSFERELHKNVEAWIAETT